MGDIVKLLSRRDFSEIKEKALYEKGLRIEVSEAIHVHRRDVRLLMDIDQFYSFVDSVNQANAKFNGKLSDVDLMLHCSVIPDRELFEDEWKIEEVKGDTIHFHYGDLRIEMNPRRFRELASLFKDALESYDET